MASVVITVRGTHTVARAPERATVYASVSHDGPDPQPVFDAVTRTMQSVRESIETLHDPDRGPVTWFAVDQVRVNAHRPWNIEGEQLPLVHSAAASVAVRFRDFDVLARWISGNAALPGFTIGSVDWTLTRRRRAKLERKTRREALRDAARRAQDYADALDLGPVRVRSVSDPGTAGPAAVVRMTSVAASMDDAPHLELRPDDVEIAAHVEATFTVSRR